MKRMGTIRLGLLLFLVGGLAACAGAVGPLPPNAEQFPYPPPGFAHRVASPAVELFWNCARPAPDTLEVAGLAFNPWSGEDIQFLKFDLVGVDASGRTVSEATGMARDLSVGTMDATPFQLTLQTAGTETRFDLFYQYRYQEPGDTGGGGERSSLPAGALPVRLAAAGPLLLAQVVQPLVVRDVCAETMHRAR